MAGFNLPNIGHDDECMLSLYNDILEKTAEFEPRYLTVPSMNKKTEEKFRQLPALQNARFLRKLNIVAKISTPDGVENIEKICDDDFFQMIMINRGGLGVNLPFEKYGLIQQRLIAVAKKYNKPVILSSHMLDSTVNNYVPSRADICNLTEAVQNGIFAVSLEQESNLNKRSVYPISVAKKIIAAAKAGL
jgi:pyruvate kinase